VRKNGAWHPVSARVLSVYRSNTGMYAQIINDEEGRTLVSASSLKDKKANRHSEDRTSQDRGHGHRREGEGRRYRKVVFDRNGYLYHGRVKALAEAAREAGLNF
jgi:large subunit ribosomal protein L18